MKYITFIIWMAFTPIVAVSTIFFIFGIYIEEWLELGNKILES